MFKRILVRIIMVAVLSTILFAFELDPVAGLTIVIGVFWIIAGFFIEY